jgi:RNA polymerase sigma-70 factor (ECF subfamily)
MELRAMVETVMVQVGAAPDLGRLYSEHARRLRGLLLHLGVAPAEADDALHEVFVVAWRRLSTLRDAAAIVPWLNGIAVRVASSSRRRARLRRFVGLDAAPEPASATTPASVLDARAARELVYRALDGIGEKKRTVFILFELHGMTGREIADTVGCPVKTVWTRLYHARREFVARVTALTGDLPRVRSSEVLS